MDDTNKVVYLNITYDCPYRCVFCVANVPSLSQRDEMRFSDLMKVASYANRKSVYVISGGEPTFHSSLIPFIRVLSGRGAKTILQTNGYKLADEDYCRRLLEAGISEIGIPFYHYHSRSHDAITQRSGSFTHAVKGMQNLLEMRQKLNSEVVIEAKLLISKLTNNNNPAIIEFLMSLPHLPDKILLKFLVMSNETEKNKDQVELSFYEAVAGVEETIKRLVSYNMPFWIAGFPLCVLSDQARKSFINNNPIPSINERVLVHYNDPNVNGLEEKFLNVSNLCVFNKNCAVKMYCSGPEETYIDKYGISDRLEYLGLHPVQAFNVNE